MHLFIFWLSAILGAFSVAPAQVAETESIKVAFTFDKPCEGELFITCFQYVDGFKNSEKAVYSQVLSCQDSIIIEGLDPSLPRAILGFVDMNGNREIDVNFFGVPVEPYAISNGFRGKWREPEFEDAAEPSTSKEFIIDFKYWKNR